MASSGKIIGGYLTGRGQRLEIEWTQTKDTANKRSVVSCVVYVRHKTSVSNADSVRDFEATCTGKTKQELRTRSWTCGSDSQLRQLLVTDPITWNVSCNATTGKHSPITLGFKYNYKGETGTWVSASEQIQLDTVPMGGIISSAPSSVAPGGSVTLGLRQYVSSYYARLTVAVGGTTVITEDLTAATEAFTFTAPIGWMTQFPASLTGTISVTYTTYSDQARTVQVGSASTKSITFDARGTAGLAPVIGTGGAVCAPENTGTRAAGFNAYVAGMTMVMGVFDTDHITTQQGASLAARKVSVEALSAETDFEAGSTDPAAGPVMTVGDKTVTLTVTDSRGLTSSVTETVKYWSWAAPEITQASAFRCDANGDADNMGTYIKVKAAYGLSTVKNPAGTDLNSGTLRMYYRQVGAQNWTGPTVLTPGQDAVAGGGGISTSYSYEVLFEVTDAFAGTGMTTVVVPKSSVSMNFLPGGDGVCFGGYATQDGFQIDWSRIDAPNFSQGGVLIRAEDANGVVKLFRVLGVEEVTP